MIRLFHLLGEVRLKKGLEGQDGWRGGRPDWMVLIHMLQRMGACGFGDGSTSSSDGDKPGSDSSDDSRGSVWVGGARRKRCGDWWVRRAGGCGCCALDGVQEAAKLMIYV